MSAFSYDSKAKILMMIDAIMDKFPFEKVHQAMKEADWKWAGVGVPSVLNLQGTAMSLMREATKGWNGDRKYMHRVSTGGLEAVVWYGELELRFVPHFKTEYFYLQQ